MPKPVRYSCAVEGYTDSWVELDPRWTRAEERELLSVVGNDAYLDLLRRKAAAVHLVDGKRVIDDVGALTDEGLADVDLVLWSFVIKVLFFAYQEQRSITDFVLRVSPPTSDKTS